MRKYVLIDWFKIALGKFKGFLVHSKSMFLLIAVGLLLNVVPAPIPALNSCPNALGSMRWADAGQSAAKTIAIVSNFLIAL